MGVTGRTEAVSTDPVVVLGGGPAGISAASLAGRTAVDPQRVDRLIDALAAAHLAVRATDTVVDRRVFELVDGRLVEFIGVPGA